MRIKVTGYIELDDDESDPTDASGMTAAAYVAYVNALLDYLEDITFEPED